MPVIRWETGLELRRRYMALAVLPVLLVVGGDYLLHKFGWPWPTALNVVAGQHLAPAEGASRIMFLTSFLLVAFASVTLTTYCVALLTQFRKESVAAVAVAAAAALALAGAYFWLGSDYQMEELVSQPLHCAAALAGHERLPLPVVGGVQLKPLWLIHDPAACLASSFRQMRGVVELERAFLLVGVPAAVFAAILCLGERPTSGEKKKKGKEQEKEKEKEKDTPLDAAALRAAEIEADKALLKLQINRLNHVLYFSGFLLVAGVLLVSTFLHYPAFALGEADRVLFKRHVQAVVLYDAVNYSLLIASFYLPAAAILGARCGARMTQEEAETAGSRFLAPVQMVKTSLAIFSPLLAGLLTEVIKLPG